MSILWDLAACYGLWTLGRRAVRVVLWIGSVGLFRRVTRRKRS